MINLELSIEKEIDFLIKYNLTPDELFLIKLIFYAQNDHPEFLSEYFSENELTKDLRSNLESLQHKGIIKSSYTIPEKGEIFKPNDVDFNKLVVHSFLQHSQTLGMELFEAYPPYTVINGKTFSLRNITKLYKSLDDMCFDYGKQIKFNPEVHRKVINILEWARDNGQITNGICDFISSHQWNMLQELQDGGLTTFDNMESL